jgi:hypothetical protein
MRNRGNEVEKESHPMFVIVVLILRASAIAIPPSEPRLLTVNLQNEWNNKIGMIGMLLPAVTKNAKIKVEVTHAKQRQRRRRGASLDVGDRLVDLERLGDRDATLGAEIVPIQAAKRGCNKIGMFGMLLPSR